MTPARLLQWVLPLAALFACDNAIATTYGFTLIGLYEAGGGIYDVKSADLDGNGKADLVVAGYNGAQLSIRRNDGFGGFGPAQNFFGDNPCAIDLADFDGDGRIDIATGKWDQGKVTLQRNLGNGAFDSGIDIPIGDLVRDLVSADFDGDGRLDLAVAAYSGNVYMLRGRPGGFDASTVFLGGNRLKAIAAGDLDGDGRPDLALCDYVTSRATLFHNEGGMTFTSRPSVPTGNGPSDLLLVDLDGDGDRDLAVTGENANVIVALNSGGVMGPATAYPIGHLSQSIAVGNFDADGWPDLVITNFTENSVEILPGIGNGVFGPGQVGALAGGLRCAAIADVDADGHPEIVTGDQGGSVRVVSVQSTLTFGGGDVYATAPGCFDVLVADLNGDQRPEILSALANPASIHVLANDGTGHFPTRTTLGGGHAIALAVLDADHDGDLDLLSANYSEGTVSYRRGQAGNGFAPAVDYAMGSATRDVAVADFDGDGEPDFATASAGTVWFRRGLGNGTFGPAISVPCGNALKGIAAGDLAGDARPDLIVIDAQQGNASILRNDGGMAFTILPALDTGAAPSDVAVGDVDLDGRIDVVVATENSRVDVFRNSGGGAWAPKVQSAIGQLAQSVELADFDGDGRPDVLTSSYNSGLVQIFRVGPSLQLLPLASRESQVGVRDATAADLNGDGKLDFVSGDDLAGTVRVFIQGAATTPAPPPPSPPAACAGLRLGLPHQPSQIVVADLDGDGVKDVAASSESGTACFLKALSYNPSGPRQDLAVGPGAKSIVAADVDGDGAPELAITESLGRTVAIFRREGTVFEELAHVEVGEHPQYVIAADLDHDGRVDLATANDPGGSAAGSITILFNRAGATWRPEIEPIEGSQSPDPDPIPASGGGGAPAPDDTRVDLPLPLGATMLAAADFDKDGELDLAAVLRSGAIVVVRAMGGGRFHPAQVLPYVGTAIAIGDFDGDTRPDLALSDPAADLVRLVYDTATQPWSTSATLPTEDSPLAVSAGDLNGDGRDDLAYVTGDGVVGTRLATGANTFRSYTTCDAGSDVRGVVFAQRPEGGVDSYVLSRGDDTALLRTYPSGPFARTLDPAAAASAHVAFGLEPPTPNPSTRGGTITFGLGAPAPVRLAIYDVRGRMVKLLADRTFDAGRHEVQWDGRDASGANARAGVYFYRLTSTAGRRVQRQILLGGS
jgi:hypothetical protein